MADEIPMNKIIEQAKSTSKEVKRPLQDRAFDYIEPFLEAERGDFRRIADLIERREWLPDNILALVAEHLRGNGATPERRTRQQMKMEFDVYCQVQDLVGTGHTQTAAIEIVAKERSKSPEAIRGYLSHVRKDQ